MSVRDAAEEEKEEVEDVKNCWRWRWGSRGRLRRIVRKERYGNVLKRGGEGGREGKGLKGR